MSQKSSKKNTEPGGKTKDDAARYKKLRSYLRFLFTRDGLKTKQIRHEADDEVAVDDIFACEHFSNLFTADDFDHAIATDSHDLILKEEPHFLLVTSNGRKVIKYYKEPLEFKEEGANAIQLNDGASVGLSKESAAASGGKKAKNHIQLSMADQVTGMAKELSAITECSICFEVYEDPRILPCIHTFCLKCIALTGNGKNPGEKMPCPVCREEFAIPKEGYGGLRKNFFMSKLIEIKSISSPSSKEKVCDACKEDIEDTECEVPLAESFCMECHQNLCQECSKHHKKNKLTKTHKVIALGNPIDVSEFTRNFPLDLCHHHATKPLEMYCEDCRNLICMLCYAESHHHHKCSGVDRLVPEFRKKMKEDADKVSSLIVEKLKESEVMKKANFDLLVKFAMAKNAIVERDQQLRKLLDQQTKSLLEELASLKAIKLKEVGTEIDEIDQHITVMNSYQTYCLNVGETGSAFDICHAVDELHSRAAQLEKAHESRIMRDVNSQQDLFQPTMLEDFLINNNNNIIGKLRDIPVFRTHAPGNENDVLMGTYKREGEDDFDTQWRILLSFTPI